MADADASLMAALQGGDESAFETLVGRHRERVFRLACRLVGNEADAPDVLQETFLQVHRGLPAFRGEARFSTWLFRIATNAALMLRRTRARRPAESLEQFLPEFDGDGRHAPEPADFLAAARADELLDRSVLARRAREGVERLPEPYRAAFVLRDLEELPTAEVAELLGLEPAAVRQRVHRARLMLRGYLEKYLKRRLAQLRSRREAVRRAMADYLPEPAWWYEVEGGVCYWLNLPPPLRADEVLIESRKRGVVFAPKHLFAVNPSPNDALRVGFTDLTEERARAGIRVIGQVVRKMLAAAPQPPSVMDGAYARVHV